MLKTMNDESSDYMVRIEREFDSIERKYNTLIEQKAVFASLDEQCRKYLGKSCDDLLAESRKQMEESVSPESEKAK